ncbi:cardiolipin synthase [Bacillus sp. SD088]|uniref:cardiolipin synthase n=1 Tax=Bacillus sp. SD088 TaxID=2782012 RepID=UPI001A96BFC4|nr:cardiolipin synthase [Bacillus sp. SD088]MBO0991592.1 cardiolipin synthase [Bacillus sp. SD088]
MSFVMIGIFIIIILIGLAFINYYLGRRHFLNQIEIRQYPIRHGRIQLITTGTNLFLTYFADLKKAKSTIQVQFYIVKDDSLSQTFFNILKQQADKGVRVQVLLDCLGSWKVPRSWIKEAKQHGIEVAFCHRPNWLFPLYSLQQRNHRKVTIIDGAISYLGGYNVGMEYIDQKPGLSPWRDYHIRIEGKGIEDLQQEFYFDWQKATGQPLPHVSNNRTANGTMKYQIFPTEGVKMDEKWRSLIRQAKHSISIGTPYFVPPKDLLTELNKALMRGVQIKVLVPNTADHPIVKEASFCYLRQLLSLGATVYQFQKGFYHAKIMIIDEQLCSIGTANFDNRSFFLNSEMTCFIYDKPFIAHAKDTFEQDIQQSEALSLHGLNQVGWFVRIKEGIGWLVKGLM